MLTLEPIEKYIEQWVDPRSDAFRHMWLLIYEVEENRKVIENLRDAIDDLTGECRYLVTIADAAREVCQALRKFDAAAEPDSGATEDDMTNLWYAFEDKHEDLDLAIKDYDHVMNAPKEESCNYEPGGEYNHDHHCSTTTRQPGVPWG